MNGVALPLQRALRAAPDLNALEFDWWNSNAGTIARVWEMPDEVSRIVRERYLERARLFFAQGSDRSTVLELGCGSGWVGQAIAGPSLRVSGVDFSHAQIELARARARAHGVEAYCTYSVSETGMPADGAPRADAALLHAYLHHLDGEEIDAVLRYLRTALAPGARIWIYEPAFRVASGSGPEAGVATRAAMRLAAFGSRLVAIAGRISGLRNSDVAARFETLTHLARRRGWYLSPKEIPLDEEAFTRQLGRYFRVTSSYWATLYLVGWAYECALLERSALRTLACNAFLRAARLAEQFVLEDDAAVRSATVAPRHAFKIWECEVPR